MRFISKIGPAKISVVRHVSDYSNEEVANFQKTFASLLKLSISRDNYRVLVIFIPIMVLPPGAGALLLIEAYNPFIEAWVSSVGTWIGIPPDENLLIGAPLIKVFSLSMLMISALGLAIKTIPLICPACSNPVPVWDTFDLYCPECGSKDSLELREIRLLTKGRSLMSREAYENVISVDCTACNQHIYNNIGDAEIGVDSHYVNYCVCTHCGLRLTDKGS